VELAIVSHFDINRVAGIAMLLEEMKEAHDAGRSPLAKLRWLWFNHFLAGEPSGEKASPGEKKTSPEDRMFFLKDRIPRIARELGIGLNEPFDYFVMASDLGPTRVTMAEGMTTTVLSPDASGLKGIYRQERQARSRSPNEPPPDLLQQTRLDSEDGDDLGDAYSSLSEGFSSPDIVLLRAPVRIAGVAPPSRPDRTPVNLSSIVALFEFDGRKILLCGDSRCDLICTGLSKAGLLPAEGSLHLDVMQVPHHGSSHNVTTEFFRRVTADHYVIDAHHAYFALPDVQTIDMIAQARGDAAYTIHTTPLSKLNKAAWEEDHGMPLPLVEHAAPWYTISVT
jgi:hypothetical protein